MGVQSGSLFWWVKNIGLIHRLSGCNLDFNRSCVHYNIALEFGKQLNFRCMNHVLSLTVFGLKTNLHFQIVSCPEISFHSQSCIGQFCLVPCQNFYMSFCITFKKKLQHMGHIWIALWFSRASWLIGLIHFQAWCKHS